MNGDTHTEVTGLDRYPREDWPPVAVVHIAFQVMDTAIPDLVAEPDQSVAVSAPDSFEQ